ncbi:class I glutamine amidotransferase-like protein [Leucogyrophana mollusca]|uniref:Class I glutamine amidotransferase-like protein n=2 Tax=Leucogyrophana mollusca TaxID=85980 RepID=A0ACB8BXX5_9AGAM|nr:class I glutamine amidotransferase-like protein [Leucogyrophana mollusca]KAH7929911.1 class I glutamine amidotransferase-like protein [Leucogyrophana mollusca]
MEGQLPTNVDEFDSVMVSGSAHSVNDSDEWIKKLARFLNETATKHPKVKLLGVCFGHQIICHAVFGNPARGNPTGWEIPREVILTDAGEPIFSSDWVGESHKGQAGPYEEVLTDTGEKLLVKANRKGWEIGPYEVVLTDDGRYLVVKANPKGWEIGPYEVILTHSGMIFGGAGSLDLEMFHHDAVFTVRQRAYFRGLSARVPYKRNVPENTFYIWGHSEKTENQGIVALNKAAEKRGHLNVDNIHIFTCQGHPELTQGMTSYLLDLFEDEIEADAVAEGRSRIANFKGILDWFWPTMIMWALSTGHSFAIPTLPDITALGFEKPEAKVVNDESVFVLVV